MNKPGNINAITNGKSLKRRDLGCLPKEMAKVQRAAHKYRQQLEAETIAAKGKVSFTDAHAIDLAATCEQAAGAMRWLLRNRIDRMSVSDIQSCIRDLRQSKADRNRAMQQLGLDNQPTTFEAQYKLSLGIGQQIDLSDVVDDVSPEISQQGDS